jgi:diguanylate cyclase (GGDEF)-like protein/PAS domain S-box-containing protein
MPSGTEDALRAEIARLNKIIQVLMNRAERNTGTSRSDFDLFQTSVMLEQQILKRTQELDISLRELEKVNRALRESENKFHSVLDQSLVGITMVMDGQFRYANLKFAEIIGYSVDEILQLRPMDITSANDRRLVLNAMRLGLGGNSSQKCFVINAQRKDGRIITVEISASSPISINGKPAWIWVCADITERLKSEREIHALQDKLREQAIRDPLTGLYNRLYLNESLNNELSLASQKGYCVSVIMIDIDHFKVINDDYGHLAGDEALKVFGALMLKNTRDTDVCCRFGGEEFFLVLSRVSANSAYALAEQLCGLVAQTPVKFDGELIFMTASFGVASYPEHANSGKALMLEADKAMYAAKDGGRNQVKMANALFNSPY